MRAERALIGIKGLMLGSGAHLVSCGAARSEIVFAIVLA